MVRKSAGLRRLHGLASFLLIAAASASVATVNLSISARRAEAGLIVLAVIFASVGVWFRFSRWSSHPSLQLLFNGLSVAFVMGFILIAAPALGEVVQLGVMILVSVYLATDMTLVRRQMLAALSVPTDAVDG